MLSEGKLTTYDHSGPVKTHGCCTGRLAVPSTIQAPGTKRQVQYHVTRWHKSVWPNDWVTVTYMIFVQHSVLFSKDTMLCSWDVYLCVLYQPCLQPLVLWLSPEFLTGWRSSSASLSAEPPHCPCSPDGYNTATAGERCTVNSLIHSLLTQVWATTKNTPMFASRKSATTHPVNVRVLGLLRTKQTIHYYLKKNYRPK